MCLKPSRPQLFGGSEDEEDGDEDKDDARFDIRPQFEGAAGQKVRKLVYTMLHRCPPCLLIRSCPTAQCRPEDILTPTGLLPLILFVCLSS